MPDTQKAITIRVPEAAYDKLRTQHRKTFAKHGLSWSAWCAQWVVEKLADK